MADNVGDANSAVAATNEASTSRPQVTTLPETAETAAADSNKQLNFRAPPSSSPTNSTATSSSPSPRAFTTPPHKFLAGRWHVTHSTLPMWKTKKNVVITYTFFDETDPRSQIDDLVTYHSLDDKDNAKQKTVRGIDTPDPNIPAAYNWRGKGWLMIASSHWEVLGWGDDEGGWVVTFFAKTLFTPAGMDVYARRKGGLSAGLLDRIKTEIGTVGDADDGGGLAAFRKLRAEMFEIGHDW